MDSILNLKCECDVVGGGECFHRKFAKLSFRQRRVGEQDPRNKRGLL